MNLALIGYGKMGHLIERLAPQYGFEVSLRLNRRNNERFEGLTRENFQGVKVAIEFSTPLAAPENIERMARLSVAVGECNSARDPICPEMAEALAHLR